MEKKGYSYLNILGRNCRKTRNDSFRGNKKEHFDIAVQKVLMGNSITSIKKIQRINF